MPRVKGGTTNHQRHKKVLKITKGHRATSHSLYKRAHESMLHALSYSYRHRRQRRREMRKLWIIRINAAARELGVPYGKFIHGLIEAGVAINRKILADMAVRSPSTFAELAEIAKKAS